MKTKLEKQKIIQEISELANKSSKLIFLSILKIPAEAQKILKDRIKKTNGLFKVFKKTLIKRGLKNLPIDLKDENFKKPLAIIFDFNPPHDINLLRNLVQISEEINFEIIKSIWEDKILEKDEILEIGKLPPLEVLRSKLLFVFRSKLFQLTFILKFPLIKIVTVVSKIKK